MKEERKKCARCGTVHPLSFYQKHQRKRHDGFVVTQYDAVCKECRSRERKTKKLERPFKKKSRESLLYHAKQEGMSLKEFEAFSGVTVDYIEGLFREAEILDDLRRKGIYHEAIGNCHSCRHNFEHKRGYDDFTIDRRDPERPFTRSNIWVICRECNTGKLDKDPTQFDYESLEYDRAKEAIKKGVQFELSAKREPVIHKAGEQLRLLVL